MIKNREQLLALSAEWTTRAKNDLRNSLVQFIEMSGLNQAQLSDILGMSIGEVEQILNGNGEITLTTFAKLLIATDHVLEIKPLAASPMANGQMPRSNTKRKVQPRQANGRFAPSNGGYPHPSEMPPMPHMDEMMPLDRNGNPLPIPTELPLDENGNLIPPHMLNHGNMPPRFGGMPGIRPIRQEQLRPQPTPQPQVGNNGGLDAMDRRSLVSLIRENNWDGDIDLVNSTRSEMIDFISEKQSKPNHENDESERIAQMLAKELERNPHLRDVIQKYI